MRRLSYNYLVVIIIFVNCSEAFSSPSFEHDDSTVLEIQEDIPGYELKFAELTPEEQVVEFVIHFTKPFSYSINNNFRDVKDIFRTETGLDAMPYLKREFAKLEFEYCENNYLTGLCNEAPMNILYIISEMVWLSSFDKNRDIILRPKDEDIIWFRKETDNKIKLYISKYTRIDYVVISAFSSLTELGDKDEALKFSDLIVKDKYEYIYNKYVKGNKELEKEVGVPKDHVFKGRNLKR